MGFISCVLVLLILAYVSFRNSERFVETNRMVSHTQEVLYELEQLLVASIELETSMRGYVIAGKREFLTPYENASLSIKQHLLKAKELTVDNPVQQENLRQLTSKLDERRSLLQRAIALRDEDGEKAAKFVSTGT